MKRCLIIAFTLLVYKITAQAPRKDASVPSARLPYAVSNQATLLIQRCEQFKYNNPDSLNITAGQLLNLAKEYPASNLQLWGLLYQGVYYNIAGESAKALELYQKNIRLLQRRANEEKLLSLWHTLGGISLMKLNRQREALELFYAALQVSEKINDKEAVFKLNNNVGWAFMELNQFNQAIGHFRKAIQLLHESNLPDRFGTIYNNLASCYGNVGKYDSAYYYAELGINTGKKYNDLAAQANGLNIRGNFLAQQNRYHEALESFMAARPLREKIGDPFYIVSDLAEMAELQSKMGETEAGIRSCLEALDIANKNKLDAKLPMIYLSLVHNYETAGNFKEAAATWKKLDSVKDRLYANASPGSLAEVQLKYETEKKEHQIQQQQFAIVQRNYWIVGITTFTILAGLLAWSLYRRYRLKQEALLQDKLLQRQEIITQAVLKAEETERQRIAHDLHDGIGQMMSAAKMNLSAIEHEIPFQHPEQRLKFNKIIELVDESCREVRAVSHNMMPNVLLKDGLGSAIRTFIDKVDTKVLNINLYSEGLNERLHSSIENILYRVIQECVNNVIKHSAAGNLNISLIKEKEVISAIIEDNGVGFNISGMDRFEGMGLKNIRTRIDYLKGTVEFDSRPGNGTLVAIHIPLSLS